MSMYSTKNINTKPYEDKKKKGKIKYENGYTNPSSKISFEEIVLIRCLYEHFLFSQKEIRGILRHVSTHSVRNIVRYTTHARITLPSKEEAELICAKYIP